MTETRTGPSTEEILAELERAIVDEAEALRESMWGRMASIAERKEQLVGQISLPVDVKHRSRIEWLLYWGRKHAELLHEVLSTVAQASAPVTYDARARRSDARGQTRGAPR